MGTPDPYAPPRRSTSAKKPRNGSSGFIPPGVLAQFGFATHALLFAVGFFLQWRPLQGATGLSWLVGLTSFFLWLHSAAVLLHRKLTLSPGWTIGVFFIPIVNFVLPFRAIAQISRAADPRRPRIPLSLVLWWGACLSIVAISIGSVLQSSIALALSYPLPIVFDVFSIVMIRDLSEAFANVKSRREKKRRD